MHKYPTVNYIGNKEKLAKWICDHFPNDVLSVFDAFSGGCSVSYESKKRGLKVYSNDILNINYHIAKGLIENKDTYLNEADVNQIFEGQPFEGFMFKNYSKIYYYPDECKQLDLYRKNIENIKSEEKKSLAFILLRRAMIRKMPYSRFTINWDKITQLRDEEYSYQKYQRRRAYHNQSFRHHFIDNLHTYNEAVFDNGQKNKAYSHDVFKLVENIKSDLIYIDPPYAGTMNNYFKFYGLIDNYINSKITQQFQNNFIDKKNAINLFDNLFSKLNNFKYWILSYNSAAYPTRKDLLLLLNKYSTCVDVIEKKHNYQITGKLKKQKNKEVLFIIENNNYDKNNKSN